MSKQEVTLLPAKAPPSGRPVLRRNPKGLVPNFWVWYEWVHEAAQLHYPYSFKELTSAPAAETNAAFLARISVDIRKIPPEDEKDDLPTDAEYEVIASLPTADARALAQSRAVREMQKRIRATNAETALTNRAQAQDGTQ